VLTNRVYCLKGRDGSFGIATSYSLDGPGFEVGWRWDFPHASTQDLGPTWPPDQRLRVSFPENVSHLLPKPD
jgi:hypothetical protein